MSQISVKYDPTIQLPVIQDMMYATNEEESPKDYPAEYQQTKVTGVMTPLIKVNKIIVMWNQIQSFELASEGVLPTLRFSFNDSFGFVKSLDQPGSDNIVQVQIIPPFDDAYKKINLLFFMTSCDISGTYVSVSAVYKVPELYQDKIQSFGKVSTYDLIDKIAKDCSLGLASNIDGIDDERYVYCNNRNYISVINEQLATSGTERIIPDIWIDLHNYFIICDMVERYNAIDNDLKVWTTGNMDNTAQADDEIKPVQSDAILSNSQAMATTQLLIKSYNVRTAAASNINDGTDKVIEVYRHDLRESSSTLIQDGDVHKDSIIKTVYMGEQFGDFNYFLQRVCHRAYMQKINSNRIEVSLQHPVLGLERGQRVNIRWYDTDSIIGSTKKTNDISTNTPSTDDEIDDERSEMSINNQVSGQYLITSTRLIFNGVNKGWQYRLMLARPQDQVKTYLNDNE